MKSNANSSLCRKFTKWFFFHDDDIAKILLILYVLLCVILCVTLHNKYGYEVESYNEDNYKYLTDIVYNIQDEDTKSIRLEYVPENVSITEANISATGTNFKCSLTGITSLVPAPFVNICIS